MSLDKVYMSCPPEMTGCDLAYVLDGIKRPLYDEKPDVKASVALACSETAKFIRYAIEMGYDKSDILDMVKYACEEVE